MSPLAAALALCLQWVTPAGEVTYYAKLKSLGGEFRIESVAADVDDVAKRVGVAPERLGALLIGENESLDPDAVSWDGSSVSLAQLKRGGPYHAAWVNACRAIPSECEWASVLIAGRVLHEALHLCRRRKAPFLCAVTVYRGGWRKGHPIAPRDIDRKVVRTAARMRKRMGGEA